MSYIDAPLDTDPDALAEQALTSLMASIPGWTPREGHLEVWVIEVMARMVAEARDVASRVPRSIFRHFGRTLLGLAPVEASKASVQSTWVMVDGSGWTVPAGTVVAFRTAGDQLVAFETVAEFVVSKGTTSTPAGAVELRAVEADFDSNGLTGAMELVDALAFVSSVTATTTSTGGSDAETDDDYLARLSQELQLLTPAPILPNDFAILARRTPGVHRAQVLDTYNPATATYGNPKTVTVVGLTSDGAALPTATRDAMLASLRALREVGFVIESMSPNYLTLTIAFEAVARAGYDAATVNTEIGQAIQDYLTPANFSGGKLSPPLWLPATHIRYTAVIGHVTEQVPGLAYFKSLTLNGAAADVALTNVWTLPASFSAATSPSVVSGSTTVEA